MNFTPAKDYEGLKKQATAMCSLVTSMEKELSFYRAEPLAKDDAKYKALLAQIESEREMNSILTSELDEMKSNVSS